MGHVERVCKSKGKPMQGQPQQPKAEARVAEEGNDHEEQVFTVSCSAAQVKISDGWLLDSGCTNHMTPDAAIFKSLDRSCKTKVKVGNVHFIKAKADKSFVVDWTNDSDSAYIASSEDSKLWHQRLGHANYRSMGQLTKQDLVENFINSVGKEDVCETQSLNGSRYFILFIDDCSRYCWIYFLKNKSEVASVFWKFKAVVETETGCKLKTLRSDNGTEYTSAQFQAFCDEAGIKHQLTNIYTPQQNGFSERKNRSLMDMARYLLFEKNLPKTLWAEAVNITVYIQNRLPTKVLAHKTLFEAWFGFKPSLAHMKVFDCIFYAHVLAVKGDKLAKKAQPSILVGYNSIKKGYRILDPSTNKVLVSKDMEKNELDAVSEKPIADQIELDQNGPEMDVDDEPVRGTRPLAEIYETTQTWKLVERPADRKIIGVKWVYRAKHNADGSLNKLKARLVVKGFSQKYGLDYLETLAPVARLDTIRLLVALAAQLQWNIHQLDVKSAFLNGFLEEKIYVDQPQVFEVASKEHIVYRLKKALYGLKQAPRAWYSRIDGYLISLGFEMSISKPTLYVKKEGTETQLIVSLYVDDLLVTGGDQVMHGSKTISAGNLSKSEGFCYEDSKQILNAELLELVGYTDNDWTGSMDDMKSTSGYVFTLGLAIFCWSSKKQSVVAQSTAEAEYVAAVGAVNQAIWLRKILADLNLHQREAIGIICDN
ncbi:hypothetical protein CXB51_010995 [Gossypium anomalum]|uniref:Integrase catalytic domain-containing protein n=1 Tax=Gossypium anomalum TaxID=47600 RepID=A0A8J5Z9D9_9ROSI|nr:hypothetical protein CXB51_010995 [Gossypium anomalum]